MRVNCVRCGVTFPTGKEFADHIRDWGECKAPTLDTIKIGHPHPSIVDQVRDFEDRAREVTGISDLMRALPDEAKVAATAQKLRVESVPPGPYIPPHWSYPSKPATPEPPEWKERKLPCIHCHKLGLEGEWCDCEQAQADMRECDAHWANLRAKQKATDVKFIQDRALEDFIVRRKAKRAAGWNDGEGHIWEDGKFDDGEFCELCGCKRGSYAGGMSCPNVDWLTRAEPIARAMSTPLPHDPDIRTRVMPWRGKP